MKISKDLIDDIFAIPRDGSNISDDDDDAFNVQQADSKVPFEEKSKEILEDVAKAAALPVEDAEKTLVQKTTIETPIKKIKDKTGYDDLFSETVTTVVTEVPKVEVPPEIELEVEGPGKLLKDEVIRENQDPEEDPEVTHYQQEMKINSVPLKSEEVVKNIVYKGLSAAFPQNLATLEVKLKDSDRKWKLLPPTEKFCEFYEEKVDVLSNYLLRGGVIPFDKYHEELRESHVDMQVDGYDMEAITEKMTEIMKWRDRVLYIKLHINKQLFAWRKYLDLLPGFLTQFEYERGKKEGTIYRHLGDMKGYLSDIEGLNQSCEDVSSHLDAAYNSFSRQVAIAQPQREIERSTTNNVRPITPHLSRYDSLSKNANSGSGVSTPQQKEVDKKSTEPKPKKGFWDNQESGK